jgi:hypothetical protein
MEGRCVLYDVSMVPSVGCHSVSVIGCMDFDFKLNTSIYFEFCQYPRRAEALLGSPLGVTVSALAFPDINNVQY